MKNIANHTLLKIHLVGFALLLLLVSCEKETNVRDGLRGVTFKATADASVITVGNSIAYIDSSVNVASRQWTFEGGNMNSSDQETVEVTYDEPSLDPDGEVSNGFLTTLAVEFMDGTDKDNGFKVQVFPRIAANFGANKTSTFSGSTIEFSDSSQYAISAFAERQLLDTYQWEFPGGIPATSTMRNPVITYPDTGEFPVSLTIFRSFPEDSITETRTNFITITEPIDLVAGFSADETMIEVGQTVNFMDTTTGEPDGWSWSFPGGTPESSTDQNPMVTYAEEGVYDVSLEITRTIDDASETISEVAYITVGSASSPFCDDPTDVNLVGCGNNDGEEPNLEGWTAVIAPDDPVEPKDRNDRLSVSTEQAFAGTGSIKYAYSEPGAPAFTDVFIDYNEKMVNVTEAGSYTLSMEHFGTVTDGVEYVFIFGLVNELGQFQSNFEGRFDADQWNNTTKVFDLVPGQYYVRIQLFNPGFNAIQSIDLFMDDISVIKN